MRGRETPNGERERRCEGIALQGVYRTEVEQGSGRRRGERERGAVPHWVYSGALTFPEEEKIEELSCHPSGNRGNDQNTPKTVLHFSPSFNQ